MTEEFQPIKEEKFLPPEVEGGLEIPQDQEIQGSNSKPNLTPVVDSTTTVVEYSPQEEASEIEVDQSNISQLDKDGFGGVLDEKSGENFSIDIRTVNRQ